MPSNKVETENNQPVSGPCRAFRRASIDGKRQGVCKRALVALLAVVVSVLAGASPAFSQQIINDFAIFGDTSVIVGGSLGTDTMPVGPIGTNGDMNLGTFIFTTNLVGSGNLDFGGTGQNIVTDVIFNGNVTFGVNVTLLCCVNAGGKVDFGGTTTIGNTVVAGGDLVTGAGVSVTNNVDVGGNGMFGGAPQLIGGDLTLGGTITSGVPTVGGTITENGTPVPPTPYLPVAVPDATPFTAGGDDITKGANQTTVLTPPPDKYGTLKLGGTNTLELTTPGAYFFDAWDIGGNLDLKLDLAAGVYSIFVVGDVAIKGGLEIFDLAGTKLDPTAAGACDLGRNLRLEVGGDDFSVGVNSDWFGTVFVPDGDLEFKGAGRLAGGLYAGNENGDGDGGTVDLGVNIQMMVCPVPFPVLTVVKSLSPMSDPGLFIMNANGTTGTEGGDGASASASVSAGLTATFSEAAGTGTDLANYTTTWSCDNGDSGTGTSGSLTMAATDVTCTFSNTRPTQTLTVVKSLSPVSDPGLFVMNANGTTGTEGGDGANASASVGVGATASFSETAGTGTNLGNYTTTWSCDNGDSGTGASGMLTMPAANVACTFSNTRITRTLTVVKSLSPVSDPGLFVMNANGTTGTEGGNGASASASVGVGATASFSEAAGTGTTLGNYTTTWSCDNGDSGSGSSGTLTMPGSDVTCTFSNTRVTRTLTVVKSLSPGSDPGLFVMNANGTAGTEGGNGASASATVDVGSTASFSESAGTGTILGNYTTTWSCDNGDSGSGSSGSLTMPASDVTCTFSNTRITRTLTVVKSLSPVSDPGLFVMNANGTTGTEGGNGASASATVDVGSTASFSEAAGIGTNLGNYTTTWSCDNGDSGTGTSGMLTMPGSDVTCAFSNTRITRTLTVVKSLSPVSDPGLFVMNANGTTGAEGGNGASASATVDVGSTASFSEAAGTGTTLGNYTTTWSCDNGDSGTGTSGMLTMPAANVACTFSNTRITRTLTVVKSLTPVSDPGLFVMNANGTAGTEGGNGASASASVGVGATANFSEAAGTGTNLGSYTTTWSCDNGDSGSGSSGSLTMPASDVTCTFSNTRITRTLTVVKSLSPVSDPGLFVMNANGTTGTEGGNGASASATVDVGSTASFSEAPGIGTNLGNYTTTWSCDNGDSGTGSSGSLTMPASDVTCTFSNTRNTQTLTVVKSLSPVSDPGLFVMNANGTTGTEGGNGASASASVGVGATANFSEAAGTGTTLGNYTTTWSCDNGDSGTGTSGSLTMPASDVTCTFSNTRNTQTLTVVKSLSPVSDPGLFVMNANGTTGTEGGNGASASASVGVGATANFSEAAGTGTNLGNYTTTWSCDNGDSGSGSSGSLTMPASDVTCAFSNTRNMQTLTVVKSLSPVSDPGLFVMNANGTTGAEGGNGASASASVGVGATANFSEAAGTGTTLGSYTTTWSCDNGDNGSGTSGSLTMPASDVTCTFSNTRNMQTLTVVKSLSPVSDPGLFVMNANGTTGTEGGNGASASATVDVGSAASFSEAAGTGTNLGNYTTTWSCDNGDSGSGTSGSLTMPASDVTCTFSNTRIAQTLTVVNSLSPVSDPGLFVMNANGTTGAEGGNGANASASVGVGATASFSEAAGTGTDLANYTTTWSCDNGASGTGTSGTLTMPAANVTCTFSNTRSTQTLTVVKSLSPLSDPGLFVMNANGTAGTEGGDGATASESVDVGSTASFSESAGAGTDLANYTVTWSCDNGDSGSGTSSTLTMPASDVICTFSNTRNTQILTVVKSLSPVSDPGLFVMNANGTSGTEGGNGASASATVDVGSTASFSEAAGAGTNLGNFTTTWSCDNGDSGSGTSGSLAMPASDVNCTFSNTRNAQTLTVVKSLSPVSDPGLFVMNANGTTGTEGGNGANASASVGVGVTASFSETAGTGTNLANYTVTWSCDNGDSGTGTSGSLTMPASDVTCTFSNTRAIPPIPTLGEWGLMLLAGLLGLFMVTPGLRRC